MTHSLECQGNSLGRARIIIRIGDEQLELERILRKEVVFTRRKLNNDRTLGRTCARRLKGFTVTSWLQFNPIPGRQQQTIHHL